MKGNGKRHTSPNASNQFLRLLLEEQKNHHLQVSSSSIKDGKKPVKVCGRRMSALLVVFNQRSHEQDYTETTFDKGGLDKSKPMSDTLINKDMWNVRMFIFPFGKIRKRRERNRVIKQE